MKYLACLSLCLAIGCGAVSGPDKPVDPVKPETASIVIASYSRGCAEAFDSAAMQLDAGGDLGKVHDDLRDKLKAARMAAFAPLDKRLESVAGGNEPDLKAVSALFRQMAKEFRE